MWIFPARLERGRGSELASWGEGIDVRGLMGMAVGVDEEAGEILIVCLVVCVCSTKLR
jgi:hypothetical protein